MKYFNLYIFCFLLVTNIINCEKLGCKLISKDETSNLNFNVKVRFYTPLTICKTYTSSLSPNKNLKEFLRKSCFSPDFNNLFIIIHGFQDSASAEWVTHMVNALLEKHTNINVLAIDWSGAFSFSWNLWNIADYRRAAISTTVAATKIVHQLERISLESSIPLDRWQNIHFIGHSLGAHVAGQAARLLKNRNYVTAHRVTGLDPAYPCFEDDSSFPRLKKSDARFVDVIHTNSDPGENPNLGTFESMGHMDFYLNGGNNQPCCNSSREGKTLISLVNHISGIDSTNLVNTFWNRQFAPICDHNFAPLFFTQSIQYMGGTFPVLVTPATYEKDKPVLEDPSRWETVQVGINAIKYKTRPGVYYANSTSLECPTFPMLLNAAYKFHFG